MSEALPIPVSPGERPEPRAHSLQRVVSFRSFKSDDAPDRESVGAGGVLPFYDAEGVTIYHGDAREIAPKLAVKWGAVVADPPYGIGHDCDYRRFSGGDPRVAEAVSRKAHGDIANDGEAMDMRWLLALSPNVVLWGANSYSQQLPKGSWLVWDKRIPGKPKNILSDAEVAWWSRGHGVYIFGHHWDGVCRASETGVFLHPTQKPVVLMSWVLAKIKAQGPVLDPFCGSGPVLRACKDAGIPCVGIDIDKAHCETAARRLAQGVLSSGGGGAEHGGDPAATQPSGPVLHSDEICGESRAPRP